MAKKAQAKTTSRGRMVHSPNPPRSALALAPQAQCPATPIGRKQAEKLADGIPLPTMRGVSVSTGDGRQIIARETKHGAITYRFAII